jgi:large subunit ribosomal protein L17
MRKRKKGRKLSRKRDQRKALIKGLERELFLKEKIITTLAKAKEVIRFAEKDITRAKEGGAKAIYFLKRKFDFKTVKKLIEELGPRYKERKGGYVRIIKLGPRKSDAAEMAQVELVK